MVTPPRVLTCQGAEIAPWLNDVARLRCEVFRRFPYLYDGSAAYEKDYLATYARAAGSVLVLALADDQVVGASTGLRLCDAEPAFKSPFLARGLPVERVFYCGESVLLSAFRGLGLGHRFFDEREAHARSLGGMDWICFASVERAADDPRRPADYRSNDVFWTKRGYVRQPEMQIRLPWKQVDEDAETTQTLTMWLRRLEPAQ